MLAYPVIMASLISRQAGALQEEMHKKRRESSKKSQNKRPMKDVTPKPKLIDNQPSIENP